MNGNTNELIPPGLKSHRESPLGSTNNLQQQQQPQAYQHEQHQDDHHRLQQNTSISTNLSTGKISNVTNADDAIREALEKVQINTYSHTANRIPPFVLDTVAKSMPFPHRDVDYNTAVNAVTHNKRTSIVPSDSVHHHHNRQPSLRRIQSEKTLSTLYDDEQYLSYANDPYVKAMGGSWFKFIRSIRQQNAYTSDKIRYDDTFFKEYDLDSPWGGDKRLKSAFVEDFMDKGDSSSVVSKNWISRLFGRKSGGGGDGDNNNTRVRSTAGYWMGENRKQLFPTLKKIFLFNPLIPLFLRILTLIFLTISLALACSIFRFAAKEYQGQQFFQQASTVMAIVVETIGIVYVIGIAYDEYHGKPLGLRDPVGKMRLIMLDLLFIIFSSANLSLTFNTLYDDEWVCVRNSVRDVGILSVTVDSVCRRQRALAAFLLVVLCLWVTTFTISLLRVVDRVTTPGRIE
ncbi:Regulator of phospholipase D SRF1 [Spathaspora sp. JA1]|nr:Regulator of phospholipase D SRF1 [Spathaspora sp. JA1]